MSELKLQIAFTRPKHMLPLSWLIMKVEKRKFSHCVIIFQHPFFMKINGPLILESSILGVEWAHDKTHSKYNVVEAYDLKLSDAEIEDFLMRAYPLIGKSYGYLAIFGIAWQKFVMWATGKKIKNVLADESTYVCSEFIGTLLTSHPLFDEFMAGEDLELFGTSDLQRVMRTVSRALPQKIVRLV